MKNKILVLALLSLCGCSYINAIFEPNPNLGATLQSTAALADHLEQQYLTLPKCVEKPKPPVCADITVVNTLINLREKAYAKIVEYSDNPNSSAYDAAKSAVDAYKTYAEAQKRN